MLTAAGIGAATGFVILGFGGLLAAYGLAAGYHVPMGPITLRRLLEPVLLGTIIGAVSALPLVWLHRSFPQKTTLRVLVVSGTPFALGLIWMFFRRPPAAFSWEWVLTPLTVLAMFLLYGFLADRRYASWLRR